MALLASPRLEQFVDLQRYPIHDLDSEPGLALLARAHKMMAQDTLVAFPGFLRDSAVRDLASELNQLESHAHAIGYDATMYGWMDNRDFADGHPRAAMLRRNCGVITTELVPEVGPTRELFEFDELTEFVRRMLGYEALYRSACPTLSIQVNTMRQGDQFGWHFDTNDGVVSFTIQNADTGGGFEYAPLIRDEDDENYDGVSRIVSGEDQPRQPDMQPERFHFFWDDARCIVWRLLGRPESQG